MLSCIHVWLCCQLQAASEAKTPAQVLEEAIYQAGSWGWLRGAQTACGAQC